MKWWCWKKSLIPLAFRILLQLKVWVSYNGKILRFYIMFLTMSPVQECQPVLQLPDLLLPGVLALCLCAASWPLRVLRHPPTQGVQVHRPRPAGPAAGVPGGPLPGHSCWGPSTASMWPDNRHKWPQQECQSSSTRWHQTIIFILYPIPYWCFIQLHWQLSDTLLVIFFFLVVSQ